MRVSFTRVSFARVSFAMSAWAMVAAPATLSPQPSRCKNTPITSRSTPTPSRPGSARRATSAASPQGSFLDKKTGATRRRLRPAHHGLPARPPAGATTATRRDPKLHGDLPKHYVEGPQICTQAKELEAGGHPRARTSSPSRCSSRFTKPGKGYKAGSTWEQTLVFQPGVRYVLCSEQITSVNDVDDLFYRIDMPGHVRHKDGDTFAQVYLSYHDKPIPADGVQGGLRPGRQVPLPAQGRQGSRADDPRLPGEGGRQAGPVAGGHDARPGRGRPRRGAISAATSASSRSCTGKKVKAGETLRRRLRRRLVRRRPGDGEDVRPAQGGATHRPVG